MNNQLNKSLFQFNRAIDVRWGDFDMLGHVNNAAYFTFLENARIHYLQESCGWNWEKYKMVIVHISMDYLKPILPEHRPLAYIRCIKIGNTSFTLENIIADRSSDEVFCTADTVLVSIDGSGGHPITLPEEHVSLIRTYDSVS